MTRQTDAPLERRSISQGGRSVMELYHNIGLNLLDLNPPYQRGDVWTTDQRVALIKSLCMGLPVPVIITNDRTTDWWTDRPIDYDAGEAPEVVIDGKQRLTTICMWFNNELAVPASWFPAEYVAETEDTEDGPYVRYEGLTKVGKRWGPSRATVNLGEGKLASVREEAEVYGLVNGAGTAQTPEDLARAAAIAQEG
jgi:hypothetical protein